MRQRQIISDFIDIYLGMCPSNPAILGLRKSASRSHSMRDQTAHMREKFLVSSIMNIRVHQIPLMLKLNIIVFLNNQITFLMKSLKEV